jgi:hypothetical protein
MDEVLNGFNNYYSTVCKKIRPIDNQITDNENSIDVLGQSLNSMFLPYANKKDIKYHWTTK